jgi:hypothetical protein
MQTALLLVAVVVVVMGITATVVKRVGVINPVLGRAGGIGRGSWQMSPTPSLLSSSSGGALRSPSSEQTAGGRQRTADSRQQTADSRRVARSLPSLSRPLSGQREVYIAWLPASKVTSYG